MPYEVLTSHVLSSLTDGRTDVLLCIGKLLGSLGEWIELMTVRCHYKDLSRDLPGNLELSGQDYFIGKRLSLLETYRHESLFYSFQYFYYPFDNYLFMTRVLQVGNNFYQRNSVIRLKLTHEFGTMYRSTSHASSYLYKLHRQHFQLNATYCILLL